MEEGSGGRQWRRAVEEGNGGGQWRKAIEEGSCGAQGVRNETRDNGEERSDGLGPSTAFHSLRWPQHPAFHSLHARMLPSWRPASAVCTSC